MVKLDRLDVEILKIVLEDGRAQYKDIAEKLHVSIPTVKSRLERLQELGVIKRFTAVIDRAKLLEKTRAVLLIKVAPQALASTAEKLAAIEEVRELHTVSGKYSLMAVIEVNGLHEVTSFISNKLSHIDGLDDVECLVVMDTHKEETSPLLNEDMALNVRCDFCKALIVERPIVEYIDGGRYYFSSPECLEAFKQKIRKKSNTA